MLHSAYKFGVAAVLLGLLFVPGIALAQSERPRKINDELHLFSNKAIDEANGIIATIKKKHRKDLWIETREKGPDKASAAKWMEDYCDKQGIDGVAILITKEPKHFEVFVGNKTMSKGFFAASDRTRLREILGAKLGKKSDEALLEVANYTLDTMNRHAPATTPAKKGAAPVAAPQAHVPGDGNSMPSWLPWVCTIVAVVIVIWIVFAIIRGITGMMGGGGGGHGPGGYGPGYGGGYGGGGGGGGFFSSMLGGLFGAAAGMYLYNNFFGGHSAMGASGMGGAGAQAGGGDAANAGTPYEADTGGTSEGGDWGGGDAPADADKQDGGGDWGGGNDGGGDAGGGDAGGGDWGGGGGGDAGGGGGGDWGGGGGGGDWGGGGGGGDFGGGGGGGGGGDW